VWFKTTPQDEFAGFDRELKEEVGETARMLASGEWPWELPTAAVARATA